MCLRPASELGDFVFVCFLFFLKYTFYYVIVHLQCFVHGKGIQLYIYAYYF